MFVSVVMSIYNGEKYLIEQLESILSQSRQPDEVIIIDDCSTDGSKIMVENFIATNNLHNWRLVNNQTNIGWRKSFIQGLWSSKGEIVFLCDQDDIWHKNKIELMELTMSDNPNITLLTSKYNAFYSSGKIKKRPEHLLKEIFKQSMNRKAIKVKYPGCTYCVRRELVDETKELWFEETPHDALLWRMAMISGGLYSINECLIDVRQHDSTFVIESRNRNNYQNKIKWLFYIKETFERLKKYASLKSMKNENIILEKNRRWTLKRIEFYKTKSIFKAFQLFWYLPYYEKFKHYLADLYIVLLSKEK